MAPDLFAINWDTVGEALGVVIVLSLFLERALALIFEHREFIEKFDDSNLKEIIAFAVALGVVTCWGLDVISILFIGDENTWIGYILTAAVIAGGSKGSIKLFHDIMKIKNSARKEKDGG